MEFDALQWALIALPVAFGFGWFASRWDWRQERRDRREAPQAVFRGLSLLLAERADDAIDAFVQAVQADPDSVELQFGLGHLFRSRGEFERAVRVHEFLLRRPGLATEARERAQRALALDFMKAGLFDRAQQAFGALAGGRFHDEAQQALLALAERSRDWPEAARIAARLDRAGSGAWNSRLAHHHCELAIEAGARGDEAEAEAQLAAAAAAAPEAARPMALAGERAAAAGRHAEALAAWNRLLAADAGRFGRVAAAYAASAIALGPAATAAARAALHARFEVRPDPEGHAALRLLDEALEGAAEATHRAGGRALVMLGQAPSLAAAQALLALPARAWPEGAAEQLRAALDTAARPLQRYRCAACGFESQRWFWQCPGCLGWDTFPSEPIERMA
jgi:lipopolysaccharide biosynthesis regulator YciM